MTNNSQREARSAFTLIELLIVVAIIGILAALLFPVFGRVRENARRSTCQSNMKQLGLAFMQYFQDYDERPPVGSKNDGTNGWKVGIGWAGQILPYAGSKQVFLCPNEQGRVGTTPAAGRQYISYGYNPTLIKANEGAFDMTKIKPISAFTAPSSTVLLSETTNQSVPFDTAESDSTAQNGPNQKLDGSLYLTGTCVQPSNTFPVAQRPTVAPVDRHLDGSNYLAADGHVKWFKQDDISWGYPRSSSTLAASTGLDGSGSRYAEGTQFPGPGKHQMTMSHN